MPNELNNVNLKVFETEDPLVSVGPWRMNNEHYFVSELSTRLASQVHQLSKLVHQLDKDELLLLLFISYSEYNTNIIMHKNF